MGLLEDLKESFKRELQRAIQIGVSGFKRDAANIENALKDVNILEWYPIRVREDLMQQLESSKDLLELINAAFNPVAMALSFALFFLEEGAQAIAMGMYINRDDPDAIKELIPKAEKILNFSRTLLDNIGILNPIMKDVYTHYFDAYEAQINAFKRKIAKGEVKGYPRVSGGIYAFGEGD